MLIVVPNTAVALFSEAARQQVADGDVFSRWGPTPGDWGYQRHSDGRCIVGALFKAEFGKGPRTPSCAQARRVMRQRFPDFGALEETDLYTLMGANDRGEFRQQGRLRSALMGVPGK